ncbi:transmembrane emp24 domain-containing protein 5-like [Cataglyphis hispanica]|uniref:transmembrane emp24 domain-containing protein 5-like n=1 Tax=Cataglyphis hispanica TaxID=1086592 RepID=UPI0021805464|nr:transmembrane emp24 domain-containing protein 5-like [Cataglyphis hispanica]
MSYHHIQLVLLGVFLFLIAPFETKFNFSYFKRIPATVRTYKVLIDSGKEDCYYQYVSTGATFYIRFEIWRNAENQNIGFEIKNPKGNIVYPWQWDPKGEYQEQSAYGGYYSICIDNHLSFVPKVVIFYFMAIRSKEWEQYKKNVSEYNRFFQNFMKTIMCVEKNINETLQTLYWKRSREEKNLNLLLDNKFYVQMWSIVQVIVITLITMLQVFLLRKLFQNHLDT